MTLEEQNNNKIKLLDVKGVNLIWDEEDAPDFLNLLDTYQVNPPLGFNASSEALNYIETELKADSEKLSALKKSDPEYKILDKKLKWRMRAVLNLITNLPIELVKTNYKIAQWTLLAATFNFNEWPEVINLVKDEIPFTVLGQNLSWINADPDSPLGRIKAYWQMVIDNHPDKHQENFANKTLDLIEIGK